MTVENAGIGTPQVSPQTQKELSGCLIALYYFLAVFLPLIGLIIGIVNLAKKNASQSVKTHGTILTALSAVFLFFQFIFFSIFAAILIPNFVKARTQGQLSVCKSNIRIITVGLETYAVDHGGVYPNSLNELVPEYLKKIPTCPTNNSSYKYTVNYDHNQFEIECTGEHPGLEKGVPYYTSEEGLYP